MFRSKRSTIYSVINDKKPIALIEQLIQILSPQGVVMTVPANTLLEKGDMTGFPVWLITKGHCNIVRRDGMVIATGKAPHIIGITEFLMSTEYHLAKTLDACEVVRIDRERMSGLITSLGLWQEIATFVAWNAQMLAARDAQLYGVNAYTIVRNKILEYNSYPRYSELNITIASFIQERSHLSPSTIHMLLASLKKGGYISVVNGILTEINRELPLEY